jgi:hypothetical protein
MNTHRNTVSRSSSATPMDAPHLEPRQMMDFQSHIMGLERPLN